MDEVCEYFHALQALKRLSPPVQPLAVGKLIQVEIYVEIFTISTTLSAVGRRHHQYSL